MSWNTGLILGFRPDNERQHYFVLMSLLAGHKPRISPVTCSVCCSNTLRLRQNGRLFADDTFKRVFLNENIRIAIKISLKFVPKSPINNIPVLVQIMAWHRPGDKPLSEAMLVRLPRHICITRPQWVLNGFMHPSTELNNESIQIAVYLNYSVTFQKLILSFCHHQRHSG